VAGSGTVPTDSARPDPARADAARASTARSDGSRSGADPATASPVFSEPWQAQAFALVESLRERGLLAGPDWTAALARALDAQDPTLAGHDYHDCRLAALETLLVERELVDPGALEATAAAWERAAHATPHGQPILLDNDPGLAGDRASVQRGQASSAR